ncbi:LysR family transcriptional regulator [Enterovibrio norvegicus FF-454]|uniref:LysR family transcriptional regulator n=1 Tax=Enterovibrio norvegicus FF-454 TaxID=1185651 RepID=A0A1E5C164_9GAMM|nr:DNA-binding transcriptional activator PunR [Enterovibrio norvegicus]OEE59245.1 LysR family transcriptional regulator [Enterovibrio norvegicus FF-454]
MFSYQDLQVVDAVARRGSFSAAAEEMHKVPSAVSYTIRQMEDKLAVNLFERLHRAVRLTPAGEFFVVEARDLMKRMDEIRDQTQRVANGWTRSVSLALDNVVREDRVDSLVRDFYDAFPDVELLLTMEVFNGVWDALAYDRADIAIGATAAVPVSGNLSYRDMGILTWRFVVSKDHPLAKESEPLRNEQLLGYPAICLEDTSRILPKRATWLLDNQRRLTVPNWHSAIQCFRSGLGIGAMPSHMAELYVKTGELVEKTLVEPPARSPCCIAWRTDKENPAVNWILDYLGDAEKAHREWLE